MKVFDVIKFEGGNNVLVWKFPGEDFNTMSQLIVHESQEAVFFKDGKALDLFGAGRYTLHSQNIPLIRRLVNLPFNGESPFHCEVYFINKVVSMDAKWGTSTPMPVQDPIYKIILPIQAEGQFAVQVMDSKKFLLQMVGTINIFDQRVLMTYFKGVLMSNIKDCIIKQFVKQKISFLEVQANLREISQGIAKSLAYEFELYGLKLVNFNVTDIAPVESDPSYLQLKQALAKKAEMNVIGYNYQQKRTYDVLDLAAANEGTSSEIMGAGLGLGMGMNIGNTIGGMMNNATGDTDSIQTTEETICPVCKKKLPNGAKFCMECGKKIEEKEDFIICPHCGGKVPEGKFCMECGGKLENTCPNCGALQSGNAKFCMECGTKLEVEK